MAEGVGVRLVYAECLLEELEGFFFPLIFRQKIRERDIVGWLSWRALNSLCLHGRGLRDTR